MSKIEQTKIENEEKQIKTNIENNQKKLDRPKPPPPRGSIGSRPKPPVPTVSKPPPSTNSPPIDKKDSTEISLSKDYVKQKNECKTQEQLQPVIYDRPKPPPPRGSVGSRPKPPVPQSVSPVLGKEEEENKTETTPPSVQTSQPINKSPQLSSQRSGSMSGRPRPPPPQTQVPQPPKKSPTLQDKIEKDSTSSQSTPPPVKKNVAPVSHKSSPPVRPSNPPPKPSKAPSKNPTPPLKPGPPKPAPQRPGPPNRPPKPGPPKPGPPRYVERREGIIIYIVIPLS